MKDESEHSKRKRAEFEEKLRSAHSAVYNTVISETPEDWDRENIVQEAEHRCRKQNRKEKVENVQAYVITIAKRLIIDTWRRYGDFRWESLDDKTQPEAHERLASEASKGHGSAIDIEMRIYLKELRQVLPLPMLLKDLTEYELRLFHMHLVDEMNFREIGKELGEEAPIVKYRFDRAMARVRSRAKLYKLQTGNKSLFKREA